MIDEEIKDLMISQEEWENMFGNDGVVRLEDNIVVGSWNKCCWSWR